MSDERFIRWSGDFGRWVDAIRPLLSKRIPSDPAALISEDQASPEYEMEAAQWAAEAVSYYYQAKHLAADQLMREGWPKSSLDSAAKASSYAELKCKDLSERVVEVIRSRGFKRDRQMKILGIIKQGSGS